MNFIIDRFEGEYAVLEDERKNMSNVLKSVLPNDVKEGDILVFENGNYHIDKNGTTKRKNNIKKLMDGLWK